ncbi:MAG: hypothetical protein E7306_03565 [Butyrivibrio sp.]|nr:hypothetical protein [Butyrivibrio sp.]
MSVLARFRSESPFAVRDDARKIEVRIIKLCMNEKYFPKRYRFILVTSMIEDAHKLVDYIEAANKTDLSPEFLKRRLTYQKEALIRIEFLFRKIILAEELDFTIPEGILLEIGEMLQKEEKLIKNWIESDKTRMK